MDFKKNIAKVEEFVGVLLIVLTGLVITAIYKTTNYMTFPNLDELLWQTRSRVFWDKILSFDFSGLIQSAQPGITVYWFTGFMMKLINFDFGYANYLVEINEARGGNFNDVMNTNDPAVFAVYEKVSFLFNLPLFVLMIVFFVSFYYLVKKIGYGRIVASFSLFFLVSNMFFIYWNTPSDKMLNIFMTLSFLTFLVYLREKAENKYLYLSAILGSLAVLSKISAFFIIPFYIFIYVYYAWPLDGKKVWQISKDVFVWGMIFIAVSVIFLPSIITNPQEATNLIFKTDGNVYETSYGAQSYIMKIPEYLGPMFMIIGSSMSPGLIIYLALFAALFFCKKHRKNIDLSPKKETYAIFAYIILFMLEVIVVSINHDIRFMSPAFVMLNVIVGIAFYNVMEALRKKLKLGIKNYYAAAALVLALSQIITVFSTSLMAQELISMIFHGARLR